jgi:hypothetical protein
MKGWLLYIVLLLTVPVYAQDSSDTETIDGVAHGAGIRTGQLGHRDH